jgi:hypothetical protein
MFGGLGNTVGSVLGSLSMEGIVKQLISKVPHGQGGTVFDTAMNVAKNGGSPSSLKRALEGMRLKDKNGNQIDVRGMLSKNSLWNNIPNDKDAIPTYGMGAAKHLGILKDGKFDLSGIQ